MKILITGAAGYIGNNLVNFLKGSHTVFGFGQDSRNTLSKTKNFILIWCAQ